MKKYKTSRWNDEKIVEVEVERESEHSVWEKAANYKNLRRSNKITDYTHYHDTWDEAYKYLLDKAERNIAWAKDNLEQVKNLKK